MAPYATVILGFEIVSEIIEKALPRPESGLSLTCTSPHMRCCFCGAIGCEAHISGDPVEILRPLQKIPHVNEARGMDLHGIFKRQLIDQQTFRFDKVPLRELP